MKFKRTISLLLTFLIVTTVFTAVPLSVSAAENAETAMVGASSGTTGDCTWTLDDNGTLTISGYGKIGDSSDFSGMNIKSVIIENGVTSIDYAIFSDCTSLTSITIPESVTSIGFNAFFGCTSLASITVNPNNKTYDSRNNCNAIIETDTNTLIVGCSTTVIPDGVTSIGGRVFEKCEGLTSITIPDSVTSIGYNAFFGCTNLASITVNPNNKTYDSRNNCNAIIETDTNTLVVGCRTTVIPDSVTSIGASAFDGCTSLTSITIPDSVTSIGDWAFSGCTNLTSITIPDSVTSIGAEAFLECTSLTSATIGNGVTSIGFNAFIGCTSLESITVNPNNKTYDSRNNCNAIIETDTNTLIVGCRTTVIPDSVTSIGNYAFYKCTSLTSITIPDSVTSIGAWAFDGCTSLTSITIGNGVTSIGAGAFVACEQLSDVYYEGNESQWSKIKIQKRNSCLTSATIHFNSKYKLGDINSDGKINIRDVTVIQRHIAEVITLNDEQLALADVNGDGKVEINDATHLQMYLAEFDVVLGKQ